MAATATLLRRQVRDLTVLSQRDLSALFRGLEKAADAERALRDVLPSLIDTYGQAAAAVAADWYDERRDLAEIKGRFVAIPAEFPDSGAGAQSLVGWALGTAQDASTFKTLILGGTQRRIANFARQTVMGSSVQDPRARGWQRVGDGNTCDFCAMLLDRAVYTEESADFSAHDRCGCQAEPVWR